MMKQEKIYQNPEKGEIVTVSSIYSNQNGVETKKSISSSKKIVNGKV